MCGHDSYFVRMKFAMSLMGCLTFGFSLIGGRVMAENSLQVGDKIPEVRLQDQDGKEVALSSYRGQKNLVVYFYPKDDTPGCTKESCSFRDQYDVFKSSGAEVIGISSDSPESHKKFATKHRLPFTLLADVGGQVRKQFGVPGTLGFLPGRVTYVIDKQGTVRHIFNSQFSPQKHITEALEILGTLKN